MGWPVSSLSYSSIALYDGVADGDDVILPAVGQVGRDPPGTDVVVVHPQAGHLLEEGEDQFASRQP